MTDSYPERAPGYPQGFSLCPDCRGRQLTSVPHKSQADCAAALSQAAARAVRSYQSPGAAYVAWVREQAKRHPVVQGHVDWPEAEVHIRSYMDWLDHYLPPPTTQRARRGSLRIRPQEGETDGQSEEG